MAARETHNAFQRLTSAGCSEKVSKALLDVTAESWDSIATKADLAGMLTKADIADMATKADLRELECRLELSLTQRVGVMLAAATSLMIAVLLVLELLGPR